MDIDTEAYLNVRDKLMGICYMARLQCAEGEIEWKIDSVDKPSKKVMGKIGTELVRTEIALRKLHEVLPDVLPDHLKV